ncbi:hypothetical protein C8T65DRAFT_644079 [Cerioporus squamosus]|nr:hypothetical protein C8T65DRAFT_644079 [Cerioporus squamosus]
MARLVCTWQLAARVLRDAANIPVLASKRRYASHGRSPQNHRLWQSSISLFPPSIGKLCLPALRWHRILNNSLVFGFPGGDPRVARVHVTFLDGSSGRWLLVEFPHRNARDIPFPTIGVNDDSRMLVIQLSPDFKLTYCDDTRACRWSVQDCSFSLVLSQPDDYLYMRDVVAGDVEADQLSEETPSSTAAIVPRLDLRYMVVVLNEIAAAMRNSISTVRGSGRDGADEDLTTFTMRIY